MTLVIQQIFSTLNALYQHQHHLLLDLLQASCSTTLWVSDSGATWIGAIQVWETEGQIEIDIKIPKIMPESLEMELTPETLLLTGKQNTPLEWIDDFDVEFTPGQFKSLIPLPGLVIPQSAIAHLTENVLSLTIEKAPQARSGVKIAISQASPSPVEWSVGGAVLC